MKGAGFDARAVGKLAGIVPGWGKTSSSHRSQGLLASDYRFDELESLLATLQRDQRSAKAKAQEQARQAILGLSEQAGQGGLVRSGQGVGLTSPLL
ncbi:MAG: hypothetical protein OIF57_08640 [Marinobacterium sp.]|nr:hypothetical protein [Marinobacterium sp.]